MPCFRLSRCAHSLASAGNVCWAKPNHGFFHCQQPVAIFFRTCPHGVRDDAHRCAFDAAHRCIVCNRNGDASMRCMQAMMRAAAVPTAQMATSRHARMHAPDAAATTCANSASRMRDGERLAGISRRTSAFARKLRRVFARLASAEVVGARFPITKNEEPATSPSRVPARRPAARISGLRLPATRRSRLAR